MLLTCRKYSAVDLENKFGIKILFKVTFTS